MSNELKKHKRKFEHHLLEGSHYEIGVKQGEITKKNEKAVEVYTSGKFNPEKSKFKDFEEVYIFYDKLCPGLSDEAQGFADTLNVNIDQLFFYDFSLDDGNCSQFSRDSKL